MNWGWVIAIEGVTLTPGISVLPTAFSSIVDVPDSERPSSQRIVGPYAPLLVPGSVRVGESAVNILSGDPPSQSLSFDLILTDALFDVLFDRPEPIGQISLNIDPDSVAFSVTCPAGTLDSIVTTGVLYIGREAYVGTASGNVWSIDTDIPSGVVAPVTTLSRAISGADGVLGHLFTRIGARTVRSGSPPWQNDLVYLAPPSLSGRRVFLYRVGRGASGEWLEQLFGQYVISGEIGTGGGSTTVTLSAASLIGTASSASLNTQPQTYALRVRDAATVTPGIDAQGETDTSRSSYVAQVPAPFGAALVPMSSGDAGFFLAVGISGGVSEYGGSNIPADTAGLIPQRQFGFASGLPRQAGALISANELLVSDPTTHLFQNQHPYWDGTRIVQNPLVMALQHLGLRASQLSAQWVLDLGPGAVSMDEIMELSRHYASVQFPGVVAGGDGRSVSALRWISDTFLRPIGCGWATDQHGRLTVRSLIVPSVSPTSVGQSNALPGRAQRRSLSVAADAVQIIAGQGGGDAPKLVINGLNAFRAETGAYSAPVYAINGQGYLSADSPSTTADLLASPSIAFARGFAGSVGEFLRGGPLQAIVRVTSSGVTPMSLTLIQDLLPGSIVDVTLVGLRGRDGVALQAIVLSHRWADSFTVQELRVLIFDVGFSRWSASAQIAGVTDNLDGTFTLTFDPDDTIRPQPYTVLGDTYTTDLQTMVDQHGLGGVEVSLRDAALEVVESGVLFDGVDTITCAATPVVGQWLTLGQLGENPGSAAESTFAFVGRDRWQI